MATGVKVTEVPGQIEPDGEPDIVTEGVAGANKDRLPKLLPKVPVETPAIPLADDA